LKAYKLGQYVDVTLYSTDNRHLDQLTEGNFIKLSRLYTTNK